MKILITGVLGYIGREVCQQYLNSDEKHKIVGLDNRFDPAKVAWLIQNGISYYQRDIMEIDDLIKDVDLIIHLAGITEVAKTANESNTQQEKEIWRVGVEGTQKVIDLSPANAKIIFPSTHVVFEGLKETTYDISENSLPCPVLSYASCKRKSELDLFKSNKNFIVLRLGTVYGYNPCVRMNIVNNIFAQRTSQNQSLKLFGGGVNIKPLVGVNDVARAIYFLNKQSYNRTIFNLTNENLTVKQLSEICHKLNKKIQIDVTNDPIPNLGYTLSNKKLLETGFSFKQNIEDEMARMIINWSNKP